MLVVLSAKLFVAVMKVTVSAVNMLLEVSAKLIQVKVSAADIWVTIFIEIMQVGVSFVIIEVVFSRVHYSHDYFYCNYAGGCFSCSHACGSFKQPLYIPFSFYALIIPLPANALPNKLAANVAANIPRNPPYCSFTSFSAVSITPFIKKPVFSRDLSIFMISSNSSFKTLILSSLIQKFSSEQLHLLLMLLPLILIVPKRIQLMVYVHFSLMVKQLLLMGQQNQVMFFLDYFFQQLLLINFLYFLGI